MVAEYIDADLQASYVCKVCGNSKADGHTCLSPTQWDFINDERRFIAFVSGRNCGKTYAALGRLAVLFNRPEYRGARVLVWGPTYNQLKGGTLVAFDEYFHRLGFIRGSKDGNEPERYMINDITVKFRNASNPDQTRGHEYAINWLDEAGQMVEDVFRLTNMCTRQRRGDGTWYPRQMIITTTPRGKNWIYRHFKDETSKKFLGRNLAAHYETDTIEAIKYGIADPDFIVTGGYVEGTLEYEQEILGRYVSWGGNVFYAYDERKHYDRTYAPPKFDRVYGGIDVGYSGAATVITLTGITSGGKFITFKEFYQRHCPQSVWMPVVEKWRDEFKVNRFYVDSAANAEIATLKNRLGAGHVKPAMKANDAAGSAVGFINGLFAQDRLLLMAVPNLRREIEGYELKEQLSGDEMTFLDKVKAGQPDDAIDSWRYHLSPLSAAKAAQHYGKEVEFAYV